MPEPPDPPYDEDVDTEAAMRAAMGFSSFSERRPKNQSHTSPTNASPTMTDSKEMTQGLQGLPDLSDSNPPRAIDGTKVSADEPHLPTPPQLSSSSASLSAQPETSYAFTYPRTGVSYTSQELDAWSRGKTNERGDKVFFKPGFVSDDPWFRLRKTGQGGDDPGGSGEKGNRS
ncbi:uncharacterized protein PV07_09797 [Cladophialophora immunda]|uniref:Uncharacterized protein n=1 Tax=Cladophialophora immunda TaxID=569365 RepID=A0A0D2C0R4_9EURO|nr:uncharacterized protein PV07_09797 [Cladophialophora immunda]KIW24060.1 hypothetical protein PV07_09797 [Cladophialophora immunda]